VLNPEQASAVSDESSEAVQVLTIRGNRIYLSREVRVAFNLRDGDKIVVYSASGNMMIKIIRRPRASRQIDLARQMDDIR
jgi:hypothetical protein